MPRQIKPTNFKLGEGNNKQHEFMSWFAHRPSVMITLCMLMLLISALAWYPPIWQPSYSVSSESPFFSAALQDVIYLNQADVDELELLPGIGSVKAEAIVEYRKRNGDFTSLDQLKNIKGIGEKTVQKIQQTGMVTLA